MLLEYLIVIKVDNTKNLSIFEQRQNHEGGTPSSLLSTTLSDHRASIVAHEAEVMNR